MEFEAKEPINRGFATRRQALKHLVLIDAAVVTNFEASRIRDCKLDCVKGQK
jgi:hypothetical protein